MSWSRERRVVAKAEHLQKGANPRFIVTSLAACDIAGQVLYETIYCQRGEMENRIKECQLDLYADRTSAATLRANQLRLWFASLAYVLIEAVRRLALQGTQLAKATAGSIRLKLLKLGAIVTVSVRRIKIAIASACPAECSRSPIRGCEASCWKRAFDATRPETAAFPEPQPHEETAPSLKPPPTPATTPHAQRNPRRACTRQIAAPDETKRCCEKCGLADPSAVSPQGKGSMSSETAP